MLRLKNSKILDGHFHFDCWMRFIATDLKVFEFEVIDAFHRALESEAWECFWCSLKL